MSRFWFVLPVVFGLFVGDSHAREDEEVKFAECPAAVRKTFQAETKGAKIEIVTRQKDDDDTVYWADVVVNGRTYAIGVIEDGTLSEMNLAVDDDDIPFDRLPPAAKATFKIEAFGAKINEVGKDMKYGTVIYEAVVDHKGKHYEIAVAEDGTLVEKVLVIEDEEIDLANCPALVRATLNEHTKGGKLNDITRSTGIGHPTYEAEIEINEKVYLIEVNEAGLLLSKSLEAGGDA